MILLNRQLPTAWAIDAQGLGNECPRCGACPIAVQWYRAVYTIWGLVLLRLLPIGRKELVAK